MQEWAFIKVPGEKPYRADFLQKSPQVSSNSASQPVAVMDALSFAELQSHGLARIGLRGLNPFGEVNHGNDR